MRVLGLAAASAALLVMAACEKASDKTAIKGPPTFSLDYCAPESVDAPSHLPPNGCVVSPNKAFAVVMQSSGAIELVKVSPEGRPGPAVWTSASKGSSKNRVETVFQEDGNLVVYDSGKPIWDSHTSGKVGHYTLTVTDQGNAVIKTMDGRTIWSAQFDANLCPPSLDAPAQLPVQGCILSPAKTYVMVMQKAGAIQVAPVAPDWSTGKPIWSSGNHLTGTRAEPFLAMQADGNLVVYIGTKAVWNAESYRGTGAYHLDLSDDGELKIHRADGAVIWSSKTGKAKL